jgi:hypothetical protein
LEHHRCIAWIKGAIKSRAAGVHPSGHFDLNAILQALTDSITEEEILEAEGLIRELEHLEDKAKCEQVLAHKRNVISARGDG